MMFDDPMGYRLARRRALAALGALGVLAALVGVALWLWGAYVAHADMLLLQESLRAEHMAACKENGLSAYQRVEDGRFVCLKDRPERWH